MEDYFIINGVRYSYFPAEFDITDEMYCCSYKSEETGESYIEGWGETVDEANKELQIAVLTMGLQSGIDNIIVEWKSLSPGQKDTVLGKAKKIKDALTEKYKDQDKENYFEEWQNLVLEATKHIYPQKLTISQFYSIL